MRSIKENVITDIEFGEMVSDDDDFQNEIKFRNKDIPFEDMSKDIFTGLNRDWTWKETANPLLKSFIETGEECQEIKNISKVTKGNPILSYVATKRFSDGLINTINADRKSKQLNEEYSKNPNNPNADIDLKKLMKKNKDGVRMAMRNIAKDMEADIEEAEEIMRIAGYSPTGDPGSNQVSGNAALELLKKFKGNKRLYELIEMIGRMKSSAISTMTSKTSYVEDEVVGIELGNDIERMCMEELCKPSIIFQMDYIENNLQQYTFQGHDPMDDGPIIICVDESGSMYGEEDKLAKGLYFGMWLIAKKNKRPMYIIRFSTEIECHEIENEMDIINILNEFMGGGTDFELPLQEVCNIIQKFENFKKADCLFITDGGAPVSDKLKNEIIEWKKKLQFRIVGLAIGGYVDSMKEFCDKIFSCNPYNIEETSKEFLAEAFSI